MNFACALNEVDSSLLYFTLKHKRWKKTITMSDAGSTASNAAIEQVDQVEVADKSGPMSVEAALEDVIKTALIRGCQKLRFWLV